MKSSREKMCKTHSPPGRPRIPFYAAQMKTLGNIASPTSHRNKPTNKVLLLPDHPSLSSPLQRKPPPGTHTSPPGHLLIAMLCTFSPRKVWARQMIFKTRPKERNHVEPPSPDTLPRSRILPKEHGLRSCVSGSYTGGTSIEDHNIHESCHCRPASPS
jgi:hypothetical protein